MSIVAPFVYSGGMVEPYVSLAEVKFSPTASAIDFTNLIEDASQAVQDRALYELIVRASSKADNYTMGVYGSLCATSNTENGRYYMNRMGQIVINPYFTPILAVESFSAGWGPGDGLQNIQLSTSNCAIERTQFIITSQSTMGLYFGNLGIVGGNMQSGTEIFCQWTYINGWANTFTNTSSVAGATSMTVNNVMGIFPGQNLTMGWTKRRVRSGSNYLDTRQHHSDIYQPFKVRTRIRCQRFSFTCLSQASGHSLHRCSN